jgi:thioredoxin-like negative regulator of GroEL
VHSSISYIAVAGVGLLLAFLLTYPAELRRLRLFQLIFVPVAFAAGLAVLPDPAEGYGSVGSLMAFFVVLGFTAILLAPNIAYACGAVLSNFLDPLDWTPAEEEIALRPIIKLIDKDRYQDALEDLETLLKKHKPTYEALHLKAKLLHHFQYFDQTLATLLQMIPLSKATQQQLLVMELLANLDSHQSASSERPVPGIRPVRITHELVLFNTETNDRSVHKEIPPGNYEVQEILSGTRRWLVLKGETWGNAEICWKAVQETGSAFSSASKKGLVSRLCQAVVVTIRGKPWRQSQEESRALHKEAVQLIRQGDWAEALPLLQKASVEDPANYEIACRLVQAAHQAGPQASAREILRKVLAQSRWTEDQEHMLKQLNS